MARAGLTKALIVDAALALVDEGGAESLTLTAVAERTGVATPSLYKHVGGLTALRRLVGRRVLDELTARLTAAVAGRSGHDAVAELMRAGRAYVIEFPGRYAAMPVDPVHDAELVTAGTRLLEIFLATLRGYGLEGSAAIHATRCLRAMMHGFVSIEAAGGFGLPEDLDETYENLIQLFTAAMSQAKRSHR